MNESIGAEREKVQDIWYGQVTIIVARWFFIGTALLLTLFEATDIRGLEQSIIPLVALIAMNFFLHGRFLVERPVRREIVLASSVVDVMLISFIIATSSWQAEPGIGNPYFIFYYPVILAFALVFPPRVTLTLTGMVLALYASVCVLVGSGISMGQEETLITRLVTMGTTAVLASMYWRMQRDWRRARLTGQARG